MASLIGVIVLLTWFASPALAQGPEREHGRDGETLVWSGKGDVGDCEFGYQLVLTPGGNTTISNATLDVEHTVAKSGRGSWHFWIGPGHTEVTVTFDWVSNHEEPNFQFVASRCLEEGEFEEEEPKTGALLVGKVVTGPAPDGTDFGFQVECSDATGESFRLADGDTTQIGDIEADSTCTVTETDTAGAAATFIGDDAATSTMVTIPADGTVEVIFTNVFEDEDEVITITLVKEWIADAENDPDGRFDEGDVEVEFLVNGDTVGNGGMIDVTPGTVLEIEEQVTGFPEECDYVARLDGSEQLVHTTGEESETITITNEVSCPPEGGPEPVPAIQIVKDVDIEPDDEGFRIVELSGEDDTAEVTYTYEVTNTGETDLLLTSLTDDQLAGVDVSILGTDTLAPGGSTSGTFTTTLGSGDFDTDGDLTNVAVVIGEAPDGTEVTDQDDVTVTLVIVQDVVREKPDIRLVKDVTTSDGGAVVVLDSADDTAEVTYTYEVTNTGETDLVLTSLTDDQLAGVDVSILGTDTLAPGESTTGTFTTTLGSGDFDRDGRHVNVAVVSAVSPDDRTVTDEDDAAVHLVEVREIVRKAPEKPTARKAPEMLPVTGASILHLLATGLLALLLGAGLLTVGRRAPAHAISGASAGLVGPGRTSGTTGNAAGHRALWTAMTAISGAVIGRRGWRGFLQARTRRRPPPV